MKLSTTSLLALCAAGSVLAGPVKNHGKHARLHNHMHRRFDNVTAPSVTKVVGSAGVTTLDTTITVQPEQAVSASSAAATDSALISYSSADGTVKALSPSVDTITRTAYSTVTYTVGSGPSASETTNQYEVVITDYVTKYVTVIVDGTSGSPAPTASGTGADSPVNNNNNNAMPAGSSNSAPTVAISAGPTSSPLAQSSAVSSSLVSPASEAQLTTYTSVQSTSMTASPAPYTYGNASAPMPGTLVASKKTTTKKTATLPKTVLNIGTTTPSSSSLTVYTTTLQSTTTQKSTTLTTMTSSSAVQTAAAPAQTGAGTVSGCTKWYVAQSGDYCSLIAQKYNLNVNTFMSWNPSVNAPSCNSLYAGYAYCVATTNAVAVSSVSSSKVSSTSSSKAPTSSASSSAKQSSTSTTIASAAQTASAPGPTGTGTVSGCTEWYVAQKGDYCSLIASNYGLNVNTFMSWNPSVNAPSCNSLYVGYAYCVATTGSPVVSTTTAAGASPAGVSTSPTAASSTTGSYAYRMYSGNGTVEAGWPAMSQWVDFDTMWNFNVPIMEQSCSQWGVPNDSADEIADMKSAIQSVSASSGVDPRFILAIIMQESNGCVRVVTTSWSVQNPGLMQTHDGAGSCNRNNVVQTPCPASEITQMIEDGTEGTSSGDGLKQCLAETNVTDVSMYYRAARIYNGGLSGYHADDLGTGCCTLCYSSDVANRLTGWHSGASTCTL